MARRAAAALFALSLPLLAACGGDDGGGASGGDESPSSTAEFEEKDLDTAVAASQEYNDRYTSGDYEGAYDLTFQKTKDAYTLEEFTKIQEACYQGGGTPVEVEGVRVEGDVATVRLVLGGFKDARKVHYEEGSWKVAPASDTNLDLSADEAAAECKSDNGATE